MNNQTYIYDERPGFESYNMMNIPYPGMPIMYPNSSMSNNCIQKDYENKINKLENDINNLQNRVTRLENNVYPQAIDYNSYPKSTYQNSMNVM